MKKYILIYLLISSIGVLYAQPFTLIINNGYGAGSYNAGTRVHIYSNSYPNSNLLFNRWQSSYPNLIIDNIDEWHTIITMPNSNVTLTATTQTLTGFDINSTNFNGLQKLIIPGDTIIVKIGAVITTFGTRLCGYDTVNTPVGLQPGTQTIYLQDREIFYYLPTKRKGVVEFYHWTNGSADGWYNSNERFESIKHMIHAGYGIIIPQSEERMRKQNGIANEDLNNDGFVRFVFDFRNPKSIAFTTSELMVFINEQSDLYQMKKIHQVLKKQALLKEDDCMYSYGFSAGAAFSQVIAHEFGYKAVACIANSGLETLVQNQQYKYKVPNIFAYGENDEYEISTQNYEIKNYITANCNALNGKSVVNAQYSFNLSPIHPKRFMQANGITQTQSLNIYNDFVNAGVTIIDTASGQVYFKHKAKYLKDRIQLFSTWNSLVAAKQGDIENIIFQINGEHCARSDFDRKIITFFQNQCDTSTGGTLTVNKVDGLNGFNVFPNPSNSGIFYINDLIDDYKVFNAFGVQMDLSKQSNILDLSKYSNGIYFLITNKGIKTKLIKE